MTDHVTDTEAAEAAVVHAPIRPRRAVGSSGGSIVRSVIRHTLMIAASVLMVYPLLWMLVSSFRPTEIIFREPGLWLTELHTCLLYTSRCV